MNKLVILKRILFDKRYKNREHVIISALEHPHIITYYSSFLYRDNVCSINRIKKYLLI